LKSLFIQYFFTAFKFVNPVADLGLQSGRSHFSVGYLPVG